MSELLWTSILAIGLAQGVFLTAALLLKSGTNQTPTRLLAAIVAAFTALVLGELLELTLSGEFSRLAAFLNINTELAIGPLGFLFVCSLLNPTMRVAPRDGLHFAPMALGLIGWSVAWFRTGSSFDQQSISIGQVPFVGYFVAFKACIFLTYLIAAYVTLTRALRDRRRFSVGRRSVSLGWLKRWLLGLGTIPVFIYLVVLLERRGLALPVESDQLGVLLLAATIYLATLMVLARPWVLSLKPRGSTPTRPSEVEYLRAYLERERPWLEPELGLSDLAEALGRSQKQLSLLINEGLGSSFYGLMTRYRLAEFDRLVKHPAHKRRGVLDLAFDSGFNSKASFYRAFREAYGTSPAAYRRAL